MSMLAFKLMRMREAEAKKNASAEPKVEVKEVTVEEVKEEVKEVKASETKAETSKNKNKMRDA